MTAVRVCASLATTVQQHLHTHKRSALTEMQSATNVGRRDTSRAVEDQRRKRRKWAKQKMWKESRNQQKSIAEGTSNSRNMATTAINSTTQPTSTKRPAGSDVTPYEESTSE